MKAAILTSLNSPLEIWDIEPCELEFGQVLVKIIVSGLCGAQLQEIAGHKGNAKFIPHLMGHEGAGIVEKIGPGVTKVKVGDMVVMHWRVGSGIESVNPKYTAKDKILTGGKITSLCQQAIVSENRLTPVPLNTDPKLCALLGCGITTALGTINNEAKVKFGESVLIVGAGGVGLSLALASKMCTAYPIVLVDNQSSKKDLAITMGATQFYTSLLELNQKFDVVIDTTGNEYVISKGFDSLAPGGRMILVAQPKPETPITFCNASRIFQGVGNQIIATQGGKTSPNEDIPRYVALHKAGLLNIDALITHNFKLSEINLALDTLRSGKAGRILIWMDE